METGNEVKPKAADTKAHKAFTPLHFTHFFLSAFRQGLLLSI
jgi:hypothetical protein